MRYERTVRRGKLRFQKFHTNDYYMNKSNLDVFCVFYIQVNYKQLNAYIVKKNQSL